MKIENNNMKKEHLYKKTIEWIKINNRIQKYIFFTIKTVTKYQKQKQLTIMKSRPLENNTIYHCQRITLIQCGIILLKIKMI